jgi:hypothetical protein
LRVVSGASVTQSVTLALADEEAGGFQTGLHAAQLLRRHFGAFYGEHVANRQITPWLLLGCVVAFWHLAEERGVKLRWPHDYYGEMERGDTPLESLTMFDGVSMEYLSELSYSLYTPRPEYFGLGIQSVLEEWAQLPNLLTIALWHLFQHTPLSIGMPLSFEALTKEYDEDLIARILRMKPLPSDTALNTMFSLLEIPEAASLGSALLVQYAFGQTENDLANWTDYEVESITMGEQDEQWDWGAMGELARLSAEAQLLEASYEAWAARITRDPEREIPKLAGALHKAARQAEREIADVGRPLITLLGDSPSEARRFIEMVNAL